MYNRTASLSKKRIIVYLKRYWWILAISILVGAISVVYNVRNNITERKEIVINAVYESQLIVSLNNNNLTTASVIGDCEMLLKTEALKNKINSILLDEDCETLKELTNVTLVRGNASNGFKLIVREENEKLCVKISEEIITYLDEQIAQYHSGVRFGVIEGKTITEISQTEEPSLIGLKDILLCIMLVAVACLIVYILMVTGKEILAIEEADSIVQSNRKVLIRKDGDTEVLSWLQQEMKRLKNVYVYYVQMDEETVSILPKENVKCVKIENIYNESMNRDVVGKNCLFLHANKVTVDQLITFKNWFELYEQKIDYLVFFE